ncbi:Hint domain-containing protein [Sulfitobacter delicatus]|uniref:Hint domain-containing protein n=1 Tax=Sulfitobacter delicatus TaxID=218672 RepID=UPI000B84910A|nr:Hint domain-containing protein [Sulfitobacter delicatus]
MPIYSVGSYNTDAFQITPTGHLRLNPDFDASTDAMRYDIEDDETAYNGDSTNDEIGNDATQYGYQYDANGNLVGQGQTYLEGSWTLDDGNGNTVTLYQVESGGVHTGWVADGPITPGVAYTYSGPNQVDSSNAPAYRDLVGPTDDPDAANSYEGGAYNDDIRAGAEADSVSGGAGDDTIDGGAGNDTLDGGTGNDTIYYGSGANVVRGGDGADWIDESASGRSDTSGDTLDGGAGNDTILSGDGNDQISGGADNDWISAEGGDDTIDGGDGDDTVYGGEGNDSISGGLGNDVLSGGGGTDTIHGGGGDDRIIGSEGNDSLYGDAGADTIHGEGGDDSISGGEGNDSLYGGADQDTIQGGAGDDLLAGEAGDDSLVGGEGRDTLSGGSGDNTMTGGAGDDTYLLGATSSNTVTDFDTGDQDRDGYYNDQLDVSELRTLEGNPVRVWDVVVSDDGFGNALLTFPEGETVVMQGVSPAQMSTTAQIQAAGVPCFTAGTMIRTPDGEVPVENLQEGDLVQTRDNGVQPVIWAGQRHLGAAALAAAPALRPIHIAPGALGNARALRLSSQHALAVDLPGAGASLLRAGRAARIAGGGIRVAQGVREVTYVHIMLERHEIVFANGTPAESFYPGPWGLRMMGMRALNGIARALPGLGRGPVGTLYGPQVHALTTSAAMPERVDDLRPAWG